MSGPDTGSPRQAHHRHRPRAPRRHQEEIATELLGKSYAQLDQRAQNVARHVADQRLIARNLSQDDGPPPSRGQRAADAVARFGGSWVFVGLFGLTLLAWVLLNGVLLALHGSTFDPYPYILLNLFLSMLASIQAPIILMSQNRQSEKDRISAGHDYEVNLKAELEIMLLHEKIDRLQDPQWHELLAMQARQLALLERLADKP